MESNGDSNHQSSLTDPQSDQSKHISPDNINTRDEKGLTPVMKAAKEGQLTVFRLLVSEHADMTLMDDDANSLIHLACQGGNLGIVQVVLTPFNINSRGSNGLTPVMKAAAYGHERVFNFLVAKHADLNLKTYHNNSMVHLACFGGNITITQECLTAENINSRGWHGWTPLMNSAAKGHGPLFDYLISKNADTTLTDDNGDTLLHLACQGGNRDIVQYMLTPSNINSRGGNGRTPIMMAAEFDHQNIFDMLVSGNADLNAVDDKGQTVLHMACEAGNKDIVHRVLTTSSIDSRGENGWTPIMYAVAHGNLDVFELLVSNQADLTVLSDIGESLLNISCQGGNRDIAQQVLTVDNINQRDDTGWTPVMVAVYNGHVSVFDLLVANSADLTPADSDSLLHIACQGGNKDIVQYFLTSTNLDSRGDFDQTPIMAAAIEGHQSVFDLLVSRNANVTLLDDSGDSALDLAIDYGRVGIVKGLLTPENLNKRSKNGMTPIMRAAVAGKSSVFHFLVERNADLTLVSDLGNSVLHLACGGGNKDIVQHVLTPSNINSRTKSNLTPIMLAALAGHHDVFDFLLSNNADVTQSDDEGNTVLHLACAGGNKAIVQTVLTPSQINLRTGTHGWTPIMTAAVHGRFTVFNFLESNNADLSLRDNHGNSLIHLASQGGNSDIVKRVMTQSNINSRDHNGLTPLANAALKGRLGVFNLLLSENADQECVDNYGDSVLHLACSGGNKDIVKYVLTDSNINSRGYNGETPIMKAAASGERDVYEFLVSKKAILSVVDDNQNSLLHHACCGDNIGIIQQLLDNITYRGQYGWTPVMMAASRGQKQAFDLLVSNGADVTKKDDKGNGILHLACQGGNLDIVKRVLSTSNINSRGQNGLTPVMKAAAKANCDVFEYLVSQNADLTLVSNSGKSLLQLTSDGGNKDVIEYVRALTNTNIRDVNGWTPIMNAAVRGDRRMFDILISHNADPSLTDNNRNSLLHLACQGGNRDIVQHVLTPENINARGKHGWTPVMTAAAYGQLNVFELLVSNNADLTLLDSYKDSLLHVACQGGNKDITRYVLTPSNINRRGQNGWTPVMKAALKGHQDVFDFLVSNQADLTLLDDYGDNLLHIACQGGNKHIVQHVLTPSNINSRGMHGWTPFMFAAFYDRHNVLQLLVSRNADITLKDYYGRTVQTRGTQTRMRDIV